MTVITVESLRNWLHYKIESETTCYEDLELTEGMRNDFHRGKVAALKDVLEAIKDK